MGGLFQLGDDEEEESAQDKAKKTENFQAGQSPEGNKENRQQGADAETGVTPTEKMLTPVPGWEADRRFTSRTASGWKAAEPMPMAVMAAKSRP